MTSNSRIPLNKVMDLLLDTICIVDAEGRFIFVSAACERVFGYTPEEMTGRPMIDFVFPEDRERTLQAASGVQAGQPLFHFENRYVRKDGQVVHIMWSARWSEADRMRIAVAHDITERKRADSMQAALYAISEAAHTAEDLVALFRKIHHIMGGLLPAGNFTVALYDKDKDELSFPYHVDESGRSTAPKPDSAALCAQVIRDGQVLLPAPGDADALNRLSVPLKATSGVIGALALQSHSAALRYTRKDVELLQFVSAQIATAIERKQIEIQLRHSARHDPLTGLPNRELFHDRLQTALSLAERNKTLLCLLYIDLDNFKQVNDTLGHPVGDLLLQEAARRLRQCVRKSDTVGRIGGDEFLVLLNNPALPEHALHVAEKIRAALGQPFDLPGRQVRISPSIGAALYPEHGDDYKQLILYADEAMYDAKKSGGNQSRMTSRRGKPA